MLEGHRSQNPDAVEEPADSRALFANLQVNFARSAIVVETHDDVSVVVANLEFVGERYSRGRKSVSSWCRHTESSFENVTGKPFARQTALG